MADSTSTFNRALKKIPRRAERRDPTVLQRTFVDSGIAEELNTVDHQILYGRRGTGKTHAFHYLALQATANGDLALYLDLRLMGSSGGIVSTSGTAAERATGLLVDLLGQVRECLLDAVLEDEDLIADEHFVRRLDELLVAITNVRVQGEVEVSVEAERRDSRKAGGQLKATVSQRPAIEAQLTGETATEGRDLERETRRGTERLTINFGDVAQALRRLAKTLSSRRIWLFLDERIDVPREVQPYLAEFLVRCVFPLNGFTVKIAAVEQQSNSRAYLSDGTPIGIELGADVGAYIDLDAFTVFEENEERARAFFANLFFKHLTSGTEEGRRVAGLRTPADVIRLGFTEQGAFDELVRAAEGVARDALYIADRAAMQAGAGRISVPLIRSSARTWFQSDKNNPLRNRPQAMELLGWIIERVTRDRSRGFLVDEKQASDSLLLSLFDARVLHIVRRGYSAQDLPGARFDVWVIDYGAYVHLIQTKNAPQSLLPLGDGWEDEFVPLVPRQDLRATGWAVLHLNEFYAWSPSHRH